MVSERNDFHAEAFPPPKIDLPALLPTHGHLPGLSPTRSQFPALCHKLANPIPHTDTHTHRGAAIPLC